MKKVLTCLFLFGLLTAIGFSEPILTEDLTFISAENSEIGLGISYGVDNSTIKDLTNSAKYTDSLILLHTPIKYGISDYLLLSLDIPYRLWKKESFPVDNNFNDSESGLGQISIGSKVGLNENSALLMCVQTPTGNIDKSLGEGINIETSLIMSSRIYEYVLSANLGYLYKSEYENMSNVKIDPANPIIIRAALEYFFEYPMKGLSMFGEIQNQIIGKTKVENIKVNDTDGTTIDLLLGTQYVKDAVKLKLGFEWAVGNENLRAGGIYSHFYDSWDWRIILDGSYKFGY